MVNKDFEILQLKVAKSNRVMNFKIYKEDELIWPVDNTLIKNSYLVRPKNGDNKRICQEQDYSSDNEIVNSAKQKLKRELKLAIEDAIGIIREA